MTERSAALVPAAESAVVPWRQSVKGGTIDDRRLAEVTVSIPAHISGISLSVPPGVAAECDEAIRAIASLDATHGPQLRPLATMLLRAESIASSKIEHETASVEDYVRAVHGVRSNSSARSMVRATGALDRLVSGPLDLDTMIDAHRRLMCDDPVDGPYAGRWRDMQNWIGGSDHSPRGAIYVPPPPDRVAGLMADLVVFAARDDIAVIPQAAIAHAQLEAIHPFTDGNGRIGRALAAAVVRRRGIARSVTVPVASALAARRSAYFRALNDFHAGDAEPIISVVATSSTVAAEESKVTAGRLAELPDDWRDRVKPSRGSAAESLLEKLAAEPVVTTEDVEDDLGLSVATTHRVIDRLRGAGIIRPLTQRTRNQVWGVGDILDELADLDVRIAARAREQ
ncbi:Fic family protein [Nocardioides albertanoniae]|uniref:Fic family protein n=1 Tax=Nocardioides albertanoniae TaxID=1175486 RepID=A0A543A279_9ACTN|nr:Fic family protein [Nocardioides albertanoniae]TQL66689.1 Fic family protein [Nocardioides albertanoniae]